MLTFVGMVIPSTVIVAVSEPLVEILPGSSVAFMPQLDSTEYRDMASLKAWLEAHDWALCDGTNGTLGLTHRPLTGTDRFEDSGQSIGSRTHEHRARVSSAPPQGCERSLATGQGTLVQVPDTGHRHQVEVITGSVEHLPLSTRVLFIMRRH